MLFVCCKQGKERQFVIEPIRKARFVVRVLQLRSCSAFYADTNGDRNDLKL